jgi:hypothetical protein
MKKRSPSINWSLFCRFFKIPISPGILSSLIVVSMTITPYCYGQQVIGSFPEMEGGFENATVAANTTTTIPPATQLISWTGAYTSAGSSIPAIYTTNVRTGTKSLQWLTGSSANFLFSKSANLTAIANTTSYVVQFYWWKAHSSSLRTFDISISPAGNATLTTATTPSLGVSAPSIEWTKQTMILTTATNATSPRYGLVQFKNNGGSIPSPGYLFDDFCVYPGGTVDDTAPDDVTNPAISAYSNNSLTPSWSAPAGGVDGGGYMLIRYTANPTSEPSPNINGIYAVGRTLGTGTIVYIGTATSFADAGLSANTAYYYKVFTVDKAFNYSPNPTVFSGFTGIAQATDINFTTPAGCVTDRFTISWTGPLNYSPADNTQIAFIKAGSAVNPVAPTNAPSTYTANTSFGAGTPFQNDPNAYCIYNADGTDGSGNHSGLTVTGLSPNTTYHVVIYNNVDAANTYSTGSVGSGTTLNNLGEPANNPTAFAKGTVTTSNVPLTWIGAAGSPVPTGYLVSASSSGAPADPVDFVDPANQTDITSGTANAKTAATTYSGFTGFAAGTMYYFNINAYTNGGSCIDFKSSGPSINVATLPNAVSSQTLSITGGTGNISWSAATGYDNSNHTTLVFVSSSPITSGTPTIDPSIYASNVAFGSGTAYQLDANAKCVYTGDGTTATVTGLVTGTTYYVLILTVVNASNYDATYSYSIYATTSTLYNSSNEYTWQGGASGDWQVSTNWTPTRSAPANIDVLIFNTAGNVTATNVLTQTIAKLSINAGDVTLQSTGATLTITNNDAVAITDLAIGGGTSLTLGSTVSMTLSTNTRANIIGTLNVNSGNTYNTNGTGVVTTVAGMINNYGNVTSTTAAKFVVNGGATYNHAKNGGTVPTGTWNLNSTCLITGITTADQFSSGSHAQTYSKFVWDCGAQNSDKGGSPSQRFVLGATINSSGPFMIVTDSMIIRRTNNIIMQLSSSGGQRDFVVGNYFQFGGVVAVTYDTEASGEQRSLTVNKTFYVTDSLETNTRFQIINTPDGENIIGRLFVGGDVEMHPTISSSILERVIGGAQARAEIWFTGSTAQSARFHTIAGNVDFVTNHTSTGVTLLSNATANLFKLMQGTFFIASNTLTINSAVSYPSPGTGALGGSSTSNLIMALNGAAGTLNFADGSRTLKDFTQMAGNLVSLGTELGITAGVSPGRDSLGAGAQLTTNDNLILRSDANGTARIAQLPVDGTGASTAKIIDKVTVERHLPMTISSDARRWRLLTAPFKTDNSPTINEAWQEGATNPDRLKPSAYDPKPGFGTHITRSTVWNASDGYDQGSTNNPSIYYYGTGTGAWTALDNTSSTKITDNTGCYMLFARGDRSIIVSTTSINAGPTTLDPKGELNTGTVSIPMASSGFQTVGNPYASEIKLDNVLFNDTLGKSRTVYLWDPKALGSFNVGKFVTCSGNGAGGYTYAGNTSPYETKPGVIESSAAFMIKGNGGGPGQIVFHESDKTIASSTIGIASRHAGRPANAFGTISELYTDLFVIRDGKPVKADGVANSYNRNYVNGIDYFDAAKFTSFTSREELSIKTKDGLFAIDRRKNIQNDDTIFLNISKLNQTEYQFRLRPIDFDEDYTAMLVDRFTSSITLFDLEQTTIYPFTVSADGASGANNRFYIVFKKKQNHERKITLVANIRDRNIALEWNSNHFDVARNSFIERSSNGKKFITIANEQVVAGTSRNTAEWLDVNPAPAKYQYRIRYNDAEGKAVYSDIADAEKGGEGCPAVSPNPVSNGRINLKMGNLPEGSYELKLINEFGRIVFAGNVIHRYGGAAKIVGVTNTPKGIYKLEIASALHNITTITVLIQ